MARHRLLHKRTLSRFHDGVSWLMQITMFLMLGLLVYPTQVVKVVVPGLALSAALMLVARPVSVWLSLSGRRWNNRERAFVSWVGLRGAVPIILATFPLASGVEHAGVIFNAVFFVVILSVALQGTTLSVVARWLKLDAPEPDVSDDREEIVGGATTGRRLHEIEIHNGSWVVGKRVVELDLPEGVWVVLLNRGEDYLVPQGPTVIEAGDRLTVLADRPELRKVEDILTGGTQRR